MSDDVSAARKAQAAPHPDDARKPDGPQDLHKQSWKFTLRNAWAQFNSDQCTDLAASLTYYAIMALFPALVALVSLLGVFGQGQSTTDALLQLLRDMGQSSAADTLKGPISSMVNAPQAGVGLAIGLLGSLWSASGYVNAFSRTMNRIYEIDEGRPIWKLRPVMLLVTVALVLMACLVLVGMVLSGSLVETIGATVGLSSQAVTIWSIVKWPVMLLLVVAMVALLYYATPNVKQPKIRWVSIGAGIAILTCVIASLAFGFYVSNFGSYNKTYGTLAGVIVSLLWLWLMNVSLLFGAELDSELERARQLQAGIPAEEQLQLPPRDDSGSRKNAEKREKVLAEARAIRLAAVANGAQGGGGDAHDAARARSDRGDSDAGRGRGAHVAQEADRARTAGDAEREQARRELESELADRRAGRELRADGER